MQEIAKILISYSVIIIGTLVLLPIGLYRKFRIEGDTFNSWLERYHFSITELVFSFFMLFLIMVFNSFHYIGPLLIGLMFIIYLSIKYGVKRDRTNTSIKSFALVFFGYIVIMTIYGKTNLISSGNSNYLNTLYMLPINLTIILILPFKERFKDFNWKITIKILIQTLIVYLLIKGTYFLLFDHNTVLETSLRYYLINFARNVYYPAFIEEIIFRGLLLTALLNLNWKVNTANITQAIIFGLIHIIGFDEFTLVNLLSTSMQIYIGYLFGKLYLTQKSLSSNIILHALFNVI